MSPRMTSGSFWKEREAEWAETRKLRERIAELEAELTRARSWLDYEKAQRSNAEAEVTEQRKAAEKLVLEFKAEIERLSLLSQKPRENGMLPSLHEHQFEYDAAEGQDTCRTCGRRQGV